MTLEIKFNDDKTEQIANVEAYEYRGDVCAMVLENGYALRDEVKAVRVVLA